MVLKTSDESEVLEGSSQQTHLAIHQAKPRLAVLFILNFCRLYDQMTEQAMNREKQSNVPTTHATYQRAERQSERSTSPPGLWPGVVERCDK